MEGIIEPIPVRKAKSSYSLLCTWKNPQVLEAYI